MGGQVALHRHGLPAGWGGPDWRETVESEIARHVFAIPGVKAVAFGAGEEFAALRGSQANDPWRTDGRRVWSVTNHSGGINGGITNGMAGGVHRDLPPHPLHRPAAGDHRPHDHDQHKNHHRRPSRCRIALRAPVVVESAAALAWRRRAPTARRTWTICVLS